MTEQSMFDEEAISNYLRSIDIPEDKIQPAIDALGEVGLITHKRDQFLISLAKSRGINEIPDTFTGRVEYFWRQSINYFEKEEETHGEFLHETSKLLEYTWQKGKEVSELGYRRKHILDGEERYFDLTHSILLDRLMPLVSYVEHLRDSARRQAKSFRGQPHGIKPIIGEDEDSGSWQNRLRDKRVKSNQKFARNDFIVTCCAIWAADLGQKFTLTTGVGKKDGEAHGKMVDFILVAAKGITPPEDMTRKKLRNFLRDYKKDIESFIEQRKAAVFFLERAKAGYSHGLKT